MDSDKKSSSIFVTQKEKITGIKLSNVSNVGGLKPVQNKL